MNRHHKLDNEPTTAWWWVKSVASWVLLIAMVGILLLTIVVPRLAGATPYTVLTSSMEPTYSPGALIVVRTQDPETLKVGDPITFQWESDNPDVVTHRITAAQRTSQGELRFTTQGDANSSPDERTVVPEQIRGKVWYSVPYVGYVNNFVSGKQRSILLAVVVGGLLIYAVSMFISSGRDNARKRRHQSVPNDGSTDTVASQVLDADNSTPSAK
ncbi:signal peptidase I [Rhodococcus sp. ABRD24]|uniref:signal peptidase I n=1 Tax=Rhodococcus sp. ABRD24 TaxID=2507582 RepID=UPI00103A6125|nr:signal peptidase I [Rhodococcus sp. ABRD24]QBJ97350.1 signal peptidase I [Rhodococcus sp. ABRD24]